MQKARDVALSRPRRHRHRLMLLLTVVPAAAAPLPPAPPPEAALTVREPADPEVCMPPAPPPLLPAADDPFLPLPPAAAARSPCDPVLPPADDVRVSAAPLVCTAGGSACGCCCCGGGASRAPTVPLVLAPLVCPRFLSRRGRWSQWAAAARPKAGPETHRAGTRGSMRTEKMGLRSELDKAHVCQ